jgi:hypothetical protein
MAVTAKDNTVLGTHTEAQRPNICLPSSQPYLNSTMFFLWSKAAVAAVSTRVKNRLPMHIFLVSFKIKQLQKIRVTSF